MDIPLSVAFEGMDPQDEASALIKREIRKLEKYHGHITSCRVTVKAPSAHHQRGDSYEVHIILTLPPHHEIIVRRTPGDEGEQQYLSFALRDAFAKARRQLQDRIRKMEGKVKMHSSSTSKRP